MTYNDGLKMMELGEMLNSISRGAIILVIVCAAILLILMFVRKKKTATDSNLPKYYTAAFTSNCFARAYEDKNHEKLGCHYVTVFTRAGQPICEYAEYEGQRILGVAEENDFLYLYTEESDGGLTYTSKWVFSPEKEEFTECVS